MKITIKQTIVASKIKKNVIHKLKIHKEDMVYSLTGIINSALSSFMPQTFTLKFFVYLVLDRQDLKLR